jgi:predicted nucleotidyltransferase
VIAGADVEHVVARIVALYDPDAIYAFGSYAKGTMGPDSDLDLIVVKPSALPRGLRGIDVVAVLKEVGFGLDLLFMTPAEIQEDLREPHSLMSTVMPTARPVYARGG